MLINNLIFSRIIIKILNFFDYFQQRKIIKLIKKKFLNPIVVIDVGAHHGETIKIFLKKLKLKKIYSFEASPINFEILSKKMSKINDKKVEFYNLGIGEKISQNYLNQTLESSSSTINELNTNSKYFKKKLKILNIKNNKKFYHRVLISITTLDFFIEKNNIDSIDLLKIDTEGFEYNVLKGLSKHINKVKLIYFEHHYDDMIVKNYKFSEIHRLLKSNGFYMINKTKMIFRKSFEYVYENRK